jgi:hypothetical protein
VNSGITRDDWLTAMREAQGQAPAPDDPSVLTVQEFAALMGICRATAEKRMRALVASGKATHTTKPARRLNGVVSAISAYRLVPVGLSRETIEQKIHTSRRRPRGTR